MESSTRYTVETDWGAFELDEESYRDYLDGVSWLNWAGRAKVPETCHQERKSSVSGISQEAVNLRDQAEQVGICMVLNQSAVGRRIRIPFKSYMSEISIQEMNLSVRALNGLMRAGAHTFGKLMELMTSERGLQGVRNLGAKSVKEITGVFLRETYQRLSPTGKAMYWQNVLDDN